MIPEGLERGDLLQVEWVDIYEDPGGDPDEAKLCRRHSIGFFWGRSAADGVPILVTTTTIETDADTSSSGFCAYPEGIVVAIKVIKRKRRKKPRKIEGNPS